MKKHLQELLKSNNEQIEALKAFRKDNDKQKNELARIIGKLAEANTHISQLMATLK